MKKSILALAVVFSVISCKKIAPGGNHNYIKLEHGTERYDDDLQEGAGAGHHSEGHASATEEPVNVEIEGVTLHAFKGGLEERIVAFLKNGGYTNAADDAALKDTWYNFDHVNFKMAAANQLEAGSDAQLKNLATILKTYPETKIKIGGYTDKTGNEANNLKLSKARAEFIKSELTKLGVGAQVVSAEGYGSEFAKIPAEASDEERATDRKMAVRFTK